MSSIAECLFLLLLQVSKLRYIYHQYFACLFSTIAGVQAECSLRNAFSNSLIGVKNALFSIIG